MFKKFLLSAAFVIISVITFGKCFAEELNITLVKQKVYDAVKLLEKEERGAFSKIRDPEGSFRFGDGQGYIWIHNMDGIMIVHPVKPALEGTPTLDLKDSRGFEFISAMNELVKSNKEGWVAYLWPKPGQLQESPKISFVKLVEIEGREYVVGCGIYEVTAESVKDTYPQDTVVTFESNQGQKKAIKNSR
jgi:signal transduction histidine kinase